MKITDYIGKTFTYKGTDKVKVLSRVPKSRTLVNVKFIDRGKGWDKDKKKYTGVKTKNGWMRGQNNQYGHQDQVHIKDLK